ncbi:MAG: 30S ribosomal protein S13 [Defluviitoga tunisiensis]|jgi:small subunit ribosomal protein S13|uniref:Small ribosomal subunit protein uS13 n=1 Tax=Defluviitoga tunisiensis TaxID=1006576 RepID=A0A0C7NVL2_DEFTU|nr:30S ribosomal protein S13 [Defluviitoga tunisiensis]MDD3600719.1 30S ribosomal protein S13 [Defluviitoga tunisiensis]MDY0379214.1 30S ribosomal protein S13 [Defluviitoga tunisiensis]CEP77513.1 30S ribosomal protein S13 [Defluviitoga tunisiensis]HHV01250.1 30S ribosomal protein S13 [Defluviitoga tunisiensis]HOB55154.1 30S ribosomal protein S13 [Defluviitoga tunisiensis]
MARILGVEIPDNKALFVGLTYIYGIGRKTAFDILNAVGIDPNKKAKDLSDDEISKITHYINDNYKVEGELRQEVNNNIKRLIDIGSYRGRRHKAGLPVRGQKTHANARTRKGPRLTKIKKK